MYAIRSYYAELAHVDDVPHGVHDAAGAEKQQRLEESVREQVEHGRAICADARRKDRITSYNVCYTTLLRYPEQ